MAYSAFALGNHLLALAGDMQMPLNPQKLQRLLFFAQAFHVALHNEPLCDDTFVVWETGPVIPGLFHKCKAFGSDPITCKIHVSSADTNYRAFPVVPDIDLQSRAFLMRLMDTYGRKPGLELNLAASRLLQVGEVRLNTALDHKAFAALVHKAGVQPHDAFASADVA